MISVIVEFSADETDESALKTGLESRLQRATGTDALPEGPLLGIEEMQELKSFGYTNESDASEGKRLFKAVVGEAVISELRRLPGVKRLWENPIIEASPFIIADEATCPVPMIPIGTANDVKNRLNASTVWDSGARGSNVVVAILDNGVDKDKFPVIDGWSPDEESEWGHEQDGWAKGHGSMCAHAAQIAAPDCKFLDIGVLKYPNNSRNAWLSEALRGINWAIEWAQNHPQFKLVFSNSWSCYRRLTQDTEIGSYRDDLGHPFNLRISSAAALGFPFVFAAGNCGNPCPDIRCGASDRGPGLSIWGANSIQEVLTVAAVDINDERLSYSSQGPGVIHNEKPDIAAYAHFEGHFPVDPGTSTAAPVAAGVVALMLSAEPSSNASDIFEALRSTGRNPEGPGWNGSFGFGSIDCEAALNFLRT